MVDEARMAKLGMRKQTGRYKIVAVRVTADEKREIIEYTRRKCVNMSALARRLLFDEIRRNGGC